MSTSHNIMIIYGFKADNPVARDRRTGECTYLFDWLETNYPALEQINSGVSNGGSPQFFVGVVVAKVKDYTRTNRPYTPISAIYNPPEAIERAVREAYTALRAIDPDLLDDDASIGLYLTADAA